MKNAGRRVYFGRLGLCLHLELLSPGLYLCFTMVLLSLLTLIHEDSPLDQKKSYRLFLI